MLKEISEIQLSLIEVRGKCDEYEFLTFHK